MSYRYCFQQMPPITWHTCDDDLHHHNQPRGGCRNKMLVSRRSRLRHDPRVGEIVGNTSRVRNAEKPRLPQVNAAHAAPRALSRARPPSRAVSTQIPASVTPTECSQWAAREPSWVTTVQSSSRTSVSAEPRVIIGSMATVTPDLTMGPRSRTR